MTLAERDEIAAGLERGESLRAIARRVGCAASTISRELSTHRTPSDGGYRPGAAQARAEQTRRVTGRRVSPAKLATNRRLRRLVQARLRRHDSPEQIAGWLRLAFPEDPEMWVSHETIYQALYVQSRGGLKRELTRHLRTGRSLRKPHRQAQRRRERRGQGPLGAPGDFLTIAERPPEVEDRAVPGHWEGDLITGEANRTAIGVLVERLSGYVILLHLPGAPGQPGNHGALAVQNAIIEAMSQLPATLRKTLTWDRGSEMANHAVIAAATDLDIYFCDPHSPWQRGTGENTNGLLRQYFPKGTDLSLWGPGILERVAAELNTRPRKRHGFRTPADILDQLLCEADNLGVADTP